MRRPAALLSVESLESRLVPNARLQLINNSPYATAQVVDVYVNNVKVANDLAFRSATGFVDVPSGTSVKIDINPGSSSDNLRPTFTINGNFADNSKNIGIVVGDPAQSTGDTRIGLALTNLGLESSDQAGKAAFLVFHGSPDVGTVDVKLRNFNTLVNDLPYGRFASDYLAANPGKYTLDVTASDGETPKGSFVADITGAADKALVVMASGFINPPSGRPKFSLVGVYANGTTAVFPNTAQFATATFSAGGLGAATQYGPDGTILQTQNPFGSNIEVRTATGDVNNDGIEDLVVAAGPGGGPIISIYDGRSKQQIASFFAFEQTFTGGIYVQTGDVNNDGYADLIITPDQGGGPRVRVLSGNGLGTIADFLGIDDSNFRGGARAAAGDLNGDGKLDLLVAAGFGGGPRVAGFDGSNLQQGVTPQRLFGDFFVFEQTLRNGVFITGGDINTDGYADLIAGGGPGGGPRVVAISGKDLVLQNKQVTVADFLAGNASSRNGVRVAAKDIDGDYKVDVITGMGPGEAAQVRGFRGKDVTSLISSAPALALNPFSTIPTNGVNVG